MLKNSDINRAVTRKIALALGSLNERVVYVGGAVVSLYIDDASADDVRPTKDLDLTLDIASLSALESLREDLIARGFRQSTKDNVVCRFRYEEVLVDIMATEAVGWAPANRWFKVGFALAYSYDLDELTIRLLPLPYFLAAKFDAFFDRGINDLFASHDFEDIVYLFNHCSQIAEQIIHAESQVKTYLMECASKIMSNSRLQEAIMGNLFHEAQDQRFDLIMAKLKQLSNG